MNRGPRAGLAVALDGRFDVVGVVGEAERVFRERCLVIDLIQLTKRRLAVLWLGCGPVRRGGGRSAKAGDAEGTYLGPGY